MNLNDLELNRYSLFVRKTPSINEDELWKQFTPRLEIAVQNIGGWVNTSQKHLSRPAARPGYLVPIATSRKGDSEFVFHNGFHRKLISTIFLDAYLVQERVGSEESIDSLDSLSEAVGRIRDQIPRHIEGKNKFSTECFCYFTELKEEDEDELAEVFRILLGTSDFTQVELTHSFFAITLQENRAHAAIISKTFAGQRAKDTASKMLDLLLPEYFLCFAKVVNETKAICQSNVASSRKQLADYLDFIGQNHPQTLAEVEAANQALSEYRAALAEDIQTIEAHLHTIALNVGNAERVLDNLLWREKKAELSPVLIMPLQYEREQIESDLTYHRISEDIARIKGEEIANKANLKAASYGRKLAWIFGVLSLIGALQLFPAFISWNDNFLKIILLGLLFFIPLWIAFNEDIRNYFFPNSIKEFAPGEDVPENEVSQTLLRELPPRAAKDEVDVNPDAKSETKIRQS